PSWFALDQWFPAMFKVWEACGYTPELLFGVTMAEALLVLSIMLVAMGTLLILALLTTKYIAR
ncbi:MAG: disulfide bond formation protein B, partial [Gammaproteobacteria bacterium]|nr:disulfide bond formation protein B [Gammaproteobacteria bacterium]